MKKLAKKLLCLTAVLALTLSLFTGCKSKNEKTLFEYAGQEVTFQEAHVYARIMQYQAEAQYGAYFGDSMWSMQVGTDSKGKKITMQQSVKDSVINQLKQIKVLAAHADDYNVKLTKSEKKQIKESVTAFAKDSTGKKVMKKTEADKDMIQKLYEESTIASKVMQAIIKKANVTVTDDEAKTVKVYKLVFTTKTTDSKTGKEKARKSACSAQFACDKAPFAFQRGENGLLYATLLGIRVKAAAIIAEVRPPLTAYERGFTLEELAIGATALTQHRAFPFPQRPFPSSVRQACVLTFFVHRIFCRPAVNAHAEQRQKTNIVDIVDKFRTGVYKLLSHFPISPLIRFLTIEYAFWNRADCSIVCIISLKRCVGITNVSSLAGTSGRADGSNIPIKQLRPCFLFSFTANVTILQQPEAKRVHTASSASLS